ncbi:unnamed protein product, partial [Iphiclides podalirius]
MQLLHEQKPLIANLGIMNVSIPARVLSSHAFEVKEKRSSDVSLRPMNPVASGDNVATDLNACQKHREELPMLVPCCEGKELQINQDLVRSGLSAISMKHESVIQCLNMSPTSDKTQLVPGLVKHRNSFRSLHRPDLKRVSYLRRLTPDELEMLFRGYADLPSRGAAATESEGATRTKLLPLAEKLRTGGMHSIKTNRENSNNTLRTTSDGRSGTEEIPIGMRLHGARARLYTSVLAGAKAGDQLDNASNADEYDNAVPEIVVPEEEVQMNEELQIILPPRCDDTADSVTTTSTVDAP